MNGCNGLGEISPTKLLAGLQTFAEDRNGSKADIEQTLEA